MSDPTEDLPPAPPPAPRRPHITLERLASLISWAVVAAATLCIVVLLPGGWVLLGTLVLGLSIPHRNADDERTLVTMLLCITVAATAVDYMAWRIEVTNWASWVTAAPLLCAELFGAVHVLGLQYTIWPRSPLQIVPTQDPARYPIFIFMPTVNEGPSVLGRTIEAALEARRRYLAAYPYGRVTIVVCNDGRVANPPDWRTWHGVEDLARRLGVTCVTRTVGGGAKAGNIEHARQRVGATGDALVVIFDADQVAKPDFLLKTIPPFADPTIGWVQTGQYYGNVEQPVARWAHDQQALFYRILCPGKAAHNAAFICGTNVVIRAAALDQIGGLPQDSVTEDFAASIALHPTWRSVFLTDVLAVGLGPMDLPAYLKQQRRWAIGTLSVLRTHWRVILLPQRNGLRLEQRIQYFLACTHYLCGLRDLIYLVSPIVFLVTGVPAVRDATLELFLWHFVPYFLAAQAAFWFIARKKTGLRGIIIGFGSFPTLIWALLIVLWGKRSGFMVTAKQRRTTRAWSHLAIYLVAVSCCLAGIAVAFMNRYTRQESAAISILWVIYDIVMLASFLWLGINDLRYQEAPVRKSQPILAFIHANCAPSRMTLRPAMARVVCSVFVSCLCLVVITTSSPLAMQPIQFRPSHQHVQSPYLGLSLRYESLRTTPLVFEQELCLPLAIVGRTQDITDAFDFPWAEQLEANHQRPWITLQFGKFDANGEPPLDASLPAIVNGIQDANIQRWAQAIYSYGQPLYLTVLLHVDRNWSVSSAVANGGIPQDTARAWEHVQSIFNAAGDTNVAWVWAPADPAHDQPYAPPDATINVVLQSMIRYPGSPWPDPTSVLQAVTARHPGEPLFVEVSGVGSPKEKAAWLQRVVASVRAFPNVHALLYHEGSPDLNATPADDLAWSFTSDPLSFHAMQQWRLLAPSVQPACGAGSGAGPGAGPGAGAGVAP